MGCSSYGVTFPQGGWEAGGHPRGRGLGLQVLTDHRKLRGWGWEKGVGEGMVGEGTRGRHGGGGRGGSSEPVGVWPCSALSPLPGLVGAEGRMRGSERGMQLGDHHVPLPGDK